MHQAKSLVIWSFTESWSPADRDDSEWRLWAKSSHPTSVSDLKNVLLQVKHFQKIHYETYWKAFLEKAEVAMVATYTHTQKPLWITVKIMCVWRQTSEHFWRYSQCHCWFEVSMKVNKMISRTFYCFPPSSSGIKSSRISNLVKECNRSATQAQDFCVWSITVGVCLKVIATHTYNTPMALCEAEFTWLLLFFIHKLWK